MRERKWTLDRVRRVVQRHSERLMGQKVNISVWRHIAIAIANRYLNKAFGQDNVEGEGGEEDEDGIEDSAWDLQAGHGTHVAGMVYARELQQGVFSTAARGGSASGQSAGNGTGFSGWGQGTGRADRGPRASGWRRCSRASGKRPGFGGSRGYSEWTSRGSSKP